MRGGNNRLRHCWDKETMINKYGDLMMSNAVVAEYWLLGLVLPMHHYLRTSYALVNLQNFVQWRMKNKYGDLMMSKTRDKKMKYNNKQWPEYYYTTLFYQSSEAASSKKISSYMYFEGKSIIWLFLTCLQNSNLTWCGNALTRNRWSITWWSAKIILIHTLTINTYTCTNSKSSSRIFVSHWQLMFHL